MGRLIGICGKSGSGKTTALRNMPPSETVIVLPNLKTQLPFPGSKKNYTKYDKVAKTGNLIITSELDHIAGIVKEINGVSNIKYLVIEDVTHYFNAETQGDKFRARKSGGEAFARWADFAAKVFNAFFKVNELRDDLTIILHFHPEENETLEGTKLNIKTPGKMLDRDIDIPSYFTYLFYTKVLEPSKDIKQEDRYKYVTNDDGIRPAKTPYGCFESLEMANDLYEVIKKIDKYENGN